MCVVYNSFWGLQLESAALCFHQFMEQVRSQVLLQGGETPHHRVEPRNAATCGRAHWSSAGPELSDRGTHQTMITSPPSDHGPQMLHHHLHHQHGSMGPQINNKTILHLIPASSPPPLSSTNGAWSDHIRILSLENRDLLFLEWIAHPPDPHLGRMTPKTRISFTTTC